MRGADENRTPGTGGARRPAAAPTACCSARLRCETIVLQLAVIHLGPVGDPEAPPFVTAAARVRCACLEVELVYLSSCETGKRCKNREKAVSRCNPTPHAAAAPSWGGALPCGPWTPLCIFQSLHSLPAVRCTVIKRAVAPELGGRAAAARMQRLLGGSLQRWGPLLSPPPLWERHYQVGWRSGVGKLVMHPLPAAGLFQGFSRKCSCQAGATVALSMS